MSTSDPQATQSLIRQDIAALGDSMRAEIWLAVSSTVLRFAILQVAGIFVIIAALKTFA